MKKIALAFIIILLSTVSMLADGVGTWKNYLSYYEPTEIEKGSGNILYVLASNGLYTYNTNDQSLQTFDKTNGLSDCTISHIKWNKNTKNLIIVYDNANIDIMYGNSNSDVVNISDYYSKSMTEDKTVNNIYIYGKHALLATAFGIVDVNMENCEISNTYNIGINVDYCYINNNTIYAASKRNGIYSCSMSQNMLDKNNWKRTANYTAQKTEDKTELFNIVKTLKPGGPKYNYFWNMKFAYGQLYTCGGAFLSGIVSENRPGIIQVLNDNEWNIFQDKLDSITGYSYMDINCVEPDILDPRHVYASGRTGLYEFIDNKLIKYYNKDNSILEGAVDRNNILGNDYVLVHSLLTDKKGSLWLLNSQAKNNSIIELNSNREFISHKHKELMGNNNSLPSMVGLMQDSYGLLWFVNNNSGDPAVVCYQTETDGIKVFRSPFINEDNTNVIINYVRCIKEDLDNNIWIGTDAGPLYIPRTEIYSNSPILTQVKVPRNDGTNYADYLLNGVDITCMSIDKGNRKWFGTNNNGVYLISSDNLTQIKHFTSANSPLLSNSIESIAINDVTGEVYFGTAKGLCSYMSDATETNNEMTKDNVWAYPNPVRPDYTGLITIIGLTFNADIKIVTSNGVIINSGRSNGGTYTWDGRDQKGVKVASGIYMVETATQSGEKGTVCKIAIVK